MPLKSMAPSIETAHFETMLTFYRDTLGFRVVEKATHHGSLAWARLMSGSTEIMLYETEAPEDLKRRTAEPPFNVMFFFRLDGIEEFYQALSAKGLDMSHIETTPYGTRSFCVLDPDGHQLGFEEEIPRTRQSS